MKFRAFAFVGLALALIFFAPPADASQNKRRGLVSFEEGSSALTVEGKQVLDGLLAEQKEGFIVEKFDIVAVCAQSEASYHHLKLSRDRSFQVYNYLTQAVPDQGAGEYELRYFDAQSPAPEGAEGGDCVIVTMYVFHQSTPKLSDPPRQLFPEEFGAVSQVPKSMKARTYDSSTASGSSKSKTSKGERFVMENIYFEGNSALYTSESEPTLGEVLAFLQSNVAHEIILIGHVNGSMGKRYLKEAAKSNPERKVYKNAEHLSLSRAESIRDYLVANGIDASRIRCEGRGGKEKIYTNPKNERQHSANRRIEIVLVRK
jgi:outer membrane protein OmpA-like peptidoglycan-associated protein